MRLFIFLFLVAATSGQASATSISVWEISGSLVSVTETMDSTPFAVGDSVVGWFGIQEVETPDSIYGPVEPRGAGLSLSVSGVTFTGSPIWSPVSYPNDLFGYSQGMQILGLPLEYLFRDLVISTQGDSQFGDKTGTLVINASTNGAVPRGFNLLADISIRNVQRPAANVPEPGTLSLLSAAVLFLSLSRRRRVGSGGLR